MFKFDRERKYYYISFNSAKPVKVTQLQTEVWGHNSKLDTHTVETHIYRLRTKLVRISMTIILSLAQNKVI